MTSVLALLLAASVVATPMATADGPLDEARDVMQRLDFAGRLTIRWDESGKARTETLDVRSGKGVVSIDGPTDAVASGGRRLVKHGDAWDLLWPGGLASPPPGMQRKYAMSHTAGPVVADRHTELVEIKDSRALRERLAFDAETGLLLRREQLRPDGSTARQLVFETVSIGTPVPAMPHAAARSSAIEPLNVSLPAPYRAPKRLAGGYERVGVYRNAGAIHVLYSDGLYGLSVFEQAGRLDRDDLARGEVVQVRGRDGHHYSWAGGHVVVWQAGPTTWTVVGDGPEDQVLAAARSLPVAPALSLSQRLRQKCRRLVETISGRF